MSTIGLCMIVKNEAKVILQCLASALPIVDYVLVIDTGSEDGTQDLIRGFLADHNVEGAVIDEPWRDFAYNRTFALERLREVETVDYAMIIDADDVLIRDPTFDPIEFKSLMEHDLYDVELSQGGISYYRPQICRNRMDFSFKGVLHEYLEAPTGPITRQTAKGFRVVSGREGARSQNPRKYQDDAAVLENALATEIDPFVISRYTFYLAQSYRDCGESEKALPHYLRRAELGYWDEEIYVSFLEAGKLMAALDKPVDEVLAVWERANRTVPKRAEALHAASRFCRDKKKFAEGVEYAQRGLKIPLTDGGLFVAAWIYEYGLLDELAVNAYWSGRYTECVTACDRLLNDGKAPADVRERVLENKNFALAKLGEASAAAVPPEAETFTTLLRTAREKEGLGRPDDEVLAAYTEAMAVAPARAEALHGAARYCRNKGLYQRGYRFATRGLALAYPAGAPSVEDWIYQYGLLDELAVNAYWVEKYAECADACDRLLTEGKLPANERERIAKNKQFAIDNLKGPQSQPIAESGTRDGGWVPQVRSAGTELMVEALKERLGDDLDRINLQINHPGHDTSDKRPRVVWMHHDVNQTWVQWCKDKALVDTVDRFVFVSYWQRERYLNEFGLPPKRCVVLRHALDMDTELRQWQPEPIWRCAYTSTPFRGLSVLLDAWDRLNPANAELHIWSSMKLYLGDDAPYEHLYERAKSLPGVIYHGLAPNAELRVTLRSMHFLAYPCIFAETACLAVIEAMAAGCRVIVPSLGALPETTGGYARVYPSNPEPRDHAAVFAENLAAELAAPWAGKPELSLSQQAHCAAVYDWPRRQGEWLHLIRASD